MAVRRFKIRINCIGYQDVEVEARNLEEAKNLALRQFACNGSEGEFCEEIYD